MMQRITAYWQRLASALRTDVIGAAVLLVLISATFAPFLFGNLTLQDSAIDTPSLFFSGSRYPAVTPIRYYRVLDAGASAWETEPYFAFERNTITSEKTAPLWNPYSAFGAPLAANMDSQPYSPFAWIPIIAGNAKAWNIFVLCRLYFAGLFTFLFLRQFLQLLPSLVGASSFMYAGYLLLYATMPHISVEALIPGLLYGVERLLRRASFGTAAFLCVALALTVLGGMPESTILAVAFALLYGVVRICSNGNFRQEFRRILAFGAVAAILALGICMVQLLPFVEFALSSPPTVHVTGIGMVHDNFSADLLGLYLAPLLHGPPWANIFNPGFTGDTGVRGFFGSVATFLALLAVFSQIFALLRRQPALGAPVLYFAAVAVALIAKRFGMWPFSELGRLPGFSLVIFTKYEEAVTACCVAVLAGFGCALLYERRAQLSAIVLALLVPLALLTVAAGADRSQYGVLIEHREFYIRSLAAALAFLAAVTAIAFAARQGILSATRIGVVALILVVAEVAAGFIIPLYYVINPNARDSDSALNGTAYIRFLQQHLVGRERFYGESYILYPNWSAAFGILDVRGLEALYPRRYLPFVTAFFGGRLAETQLTRFDGGDKFDFAQPMDQRFLTLSSVRYVGALVDLAGHAGSPFRLVFQQPGASIYEYRSPLPRVSIYQHVVRVPNPESALAILTDPKFEPKFEAVVDSASAGLEVLTASSRSPVRAGRLEAYSTRYARASVDTAVPAFVVLNDTAFPGWNALVDGRPAQILSANYLFRGLIVTPGKHIIEFKYQPASFAVGAEISMASLFLLALICVAARLRRASSMAP